MYEDITQGLLLNRMLERISDSLDKRPSAVIYDTASTTAVELENLYIEMEYLIKNSYGDTAAREFLILLAKDRGIVPRPATNAVLRGEFIPDTVEVLGRRFNISNINYTVTQKISSGEYQVTCESQGVVGNQYLGAMVPIEYIDGLESATLTEILVPGEDVEDTESLRERYLNSFNGQSFGGNRTDYIEKVKAIEGVGAVKVTRVWNGDIRPADLIPSDTVKTWYNTVIGTLDTDVAAWLTSAYLAAESRKLTVGGTVLVTVLNSLDWGAPSDVLIDNIQTILDPEQNTGEGLGAAPIGHVVNVQGGAPVTIDVTAVVTFDQGYGWDNLQTPINTAVANYLLELRQAWEDSTSLIVRISQIETRILSVNGVIDITGTSINGSSDNLTLGNYEVPVMGGVSDGT